MYEYQADNLNEEINQKIRFFTNEKYFKLFSYMLTKKSKNFSAFKKVSSLVLSIDYLEKEKEIKKNKKLNLVKKEENKKQISPWFYFMIHICNVPNKKKYIKPKKNEFNIETIIYSYMTSLCQNKIKLLNNFSITHHLNMDKLVKFYLDLCLNKIVQEKENIKNNEIEEQNSFDNNNINNIYNRNHHKRKSKFKFTFKFPSSDYKNKINFKSQKNHQIKSNTKIKISNLFQSRNKKDRKQIDYSQSFTRLFIGETDQKSVIARYLSNIVIKKIKQMHLFNKKINLSSLYLKKMYKKLFRDENNIDNEMNVLVNKFKLDSKMVENYKRNTLSFDKKQNEEKYIDEDREKLQKQLDKQINVYTKPILERNKYHTFNKVSKFSLHTPDNKILTRFKKNRNSFINNKKNKNKSFLSNLSSDYNFGLSPKYSRNDSRNLSGLKMSYTNNSKTNSSIKLKYSKYNVKFNLKYSPVSIFKFKIKNNSINEDNDLFINIKKKLNKENEHFHFKDKRYIFNSSME